MSEKIEPIEFKFSLRNSKENPVWIVGTAKIDGVNYGINGKVFLDGSVFGIDNGPISKLYIRNENERKVIVNYERGWDIVPETEYDKQIMDRVMQELQKFRKKHPYEPNM